MDNDEIEKLQFSDENSNDRIKTKKKRNYQ